MPDTGFHQVMAGLMYIQSYLAFPAEVINREKDLVPRQLGTVSDDLFEVTSLRATHHVQDSLSRGLCHPRPRDSTIATFSHVHRQCHE